MIKVTQIINDSQKGIRLEAKFGAHITINSIMPKYPSLTTVRDTLSQEYESNKALLKRMQGSLRAAQKAVSNQERIISEYSEDLKQMNKEISEIKDLISD